MSKIAFLVSGEKMFKKIKKYIDIDIENIIVVETTISNALEKAKKLIDEGVKVILTKLAIKIKIEDEIDIPILSIENNISDYIELLKEIDIKNNKINYIRNLNFLEKFLIINPNIYIEISKIILVNFSENKKASCSYFENLFDEALYTPEKLLLLYNDEIEVLYNIYYKLLEEGI